MKLKIILIAIIINWHFSSVAQNIPVNNVASSYTSNPVAIPVYSGIKVNYVRTYEPAKPVTDEASILVATPSELRQHTQYLDGLGRPFQNVSRAVSNNFKDVVSTIVYDAFGREVYKYLPYTSTYNDGNFKQDAFSEQKLFMQQQYGNQGEQFYYARMEFEPSALNRIKKNLPAGNSWVGSNRGVQLDYHTNTADDDVKIWAVTDVAESFGTYTVTGVYAAGELFKNITIDENNKQIIEFKDREDNLILKKVQLTATGTGYADWICTYYIYDDLNNLRCVIQPKAVEALAAGNWKLTGLMLAEQCFRYEFDSKKRMILKKQPGSAEVCMLYDKRDRLIFSQDGNLKSKSRWMTILYDMLNRAVTTGITIATKQQLQDQLDNEQFNTTSITVQGSSTIKDLAVNNYLTGTTLYRAGYSITFNPGFESDVSAAFIAEIMTVTGTPSSIQVTGNPLPPGVVFYALTITRYDDYTFTNKSYRNADNTKLDGGDNSFPDPLPAAASPQTLGLSTGNKVWLMEDGVDLSQGRWLETIIFYDEKYRPVQVLAENHCGGTERITTRYDFVGKPICIYNQHDNPASTLGMLRVKTNKNYDHGGRLKDVVKQINDDIATRRVIVQLEYDELGQLKKKKLGNDPVTSLPLETIDYDYNIRGWLNSLNGGYAKNTNSNNYFGEALSYDVGFTSKLYNGNIAGQQWRSKGDGEQRAYGYDYDAVNRLVKADFTQNNGGWNVTAGVDFSVSNLSYDRNGNISTVSQKGLKINESPYIDQLQYTYPYMGNKLQQVTDGSNDNNSTLGDFKYDVSTKNPTADYIYDPNGNMIADNNRSVSNIIYNHLNLPVVITVGGKGTFTFTYDAAGNKLQKSTIDNTATTVQVSTTEYLNDFVYENGVLQFISHEDGRIRYKPLENRFVYDYFLKDHLGNVRMVITDDKQQDIYPAATLETAKLSTEKQFYDIKEGSVAERIPGIPDYVNNNGILNPPPDIVFDNTNSMKLYKLNSSFQKTGLGITLKVMAGDRIDIFGKSFYSQVNTGSNGVNSNLVALEIINAFLASPGGNISKATTAQIMRNKDGMAVPLGNFLNNNSPSTATTPKAFIIYILLDEQFKFVGGGASPVSSSESNVKLKDHFAELQNLAVTKNGFMYVYCSNESPVDVFFDNVQVVHTRGPILEETHYYPFGLTMAGISSRAAGMMANKEQTFQEQRLIDDLDLNWIPFKWRTHDPQIGRFLQMDPLSDDYRYQSPYIFSENRVTDGRELEGLEYVSIHHYANGYNGIKRFYQSSDEEINRRGGTTRGIYNSASYGPLGKGVVHYYYNSKGIMQSEKTRWEQQQKGSSSDFKYHGLYSGPGCITKDGTANGPNYDFTMQPLDWADAIAKKHDKDYVDATGTGEKYAGFLEDVRTLKADRDMVARVLDLLGDIDNPFKKNGVAGVDQPFRTSTSGEMRMALEGQLTVISSLAIYKQWKVDNKKANSDKWANLRNQFYKYNPVTAVIIDILSMNK